MKIPTGTGFSAVGIGRDFGTYYEISYFSEERRKIVAIQKKRTSLQDALRGDFAKKGHAELQSDLEELFNTLTGYELADAVIERVQRYAAEASGKTMDRDFGRIEPYTLDQIKEKIREELIGHLSSFISDVHREFIVRCHAQGLSTADAIVELMVADETINRLAREDAMGLLKLREMLIPRLAYLKPGSARWPEKKYGTVWREEREAYKQEVRDIPFTSQVEQVALLARQANRINRALETGGHSVKDMQMLTNSLVKTVEGLRKVSAVDEPVNLSAPQLIAVLERLTLALRAPEQKAIGGEAEELVGVLERLTLALRTPEHRSNGNKALPAEAGGVGGE